MVDLAQQDLKTNERDVYERILREDGPNREILVQLAISYACGGKIKLAFEAYVSANAYKSVNLSDIQHLVKALIRCVKDKKKRDSRPDTYDLFRCGQCLSLYENPVTVACGHTYCKNCLPKDELQKCIKCNRPFNMQKLSMSTNILLSSLIKKCFPGSAEIVKLKENAHGYFTAKEYKKALDTYICARKEAPNDYWIASNLSIINMKLGHFNKALEHADTTIKLCPDCSNGYYRKALALVELARLEEAVKVLLDCLTLTPEKKVAMDLLAEILLKMLVPLHDQQRGLKSVLLPYFGDVRESDGGNTCETLTESCGNKLLDDQGSSEKKTDVSDLEETGEKSNHSSSSSDPSDDNQFHLTKEDFECAICMRFLLEPVTTPCGHTYCRECLNRCLDHQNVCPLCKQSLVEYLADHCHAITHATNSIMKFYLPKECLKSEQQYETEQLNGQIPIFESTVAYPQIRCPLHVFEPRYKLMIRQCMELGTRQFGMCIPIKNGQDFASIGCMLKILDVHYFTDGRALVETVGGRRFKVLEKGNKDGYSTAKVEFIADTTVHQDGVPALKKMNEETYTAVKNWYEKLVGPPRDRIDQHAGPMPPLEDFDCNSVDGQTWSWWFIRVMPIEPRAQQTLLGMTSLSNRLNAIKRIINYTCKKAT